jgi:hypothetical protein
VTAPSNCQVEFAKKKFDWPIRPVVSDAERSRSAPSACFRHSDFCWKARSRFVLAIALDLLIAFVERAAANMGDFQLSDADAPIVAEICRKLDGLPVAIEFATARVAPFSVRRLAAHLYERLRLLMSGRPTPSYRAFRDGPSDSRPLYCDARFLGARAFRSIG